MALASVQLRSNATFHNRSLYRRGSSASSESSVKLLAGHVGRLTLKKKKKKNCEGQVCTLNCKPSARPSLFVFPFCVPLLVVFMLNRDLSASSNLGGQIMCLYVPPINGLCIRTPKHNLNLPVCFSYLERTAWGLCL